MWRESTYNKQLDNMMIYVYRYDKFGQHIASRIGGGGLDKLHNHVVIPEGKLTQMNERVCEGGRLHYFCREDAEPERSRSLVVAKPEPEELPPCSENEYTLYFNTELRLLHEYRDIRHDEPETYFYHPDHLGSSSWITNRTGDAIQHLQYLPFGEQYVDQRATGWNAMFTFSGKERDEETGYSYFGARYYDSDLSIWLSVDPMASKYPSLSPYVYCANNPVKLVDPDGREIINGYTTDLAAATDKVAKAQSAFNAFGGNKKADGYKDAKNELKAANKELKTTQGNYDIVQGTMKDLRTHNGSLYNELDNLKDENGTTVDVHIRLANIEGRYGQVVENYNTGTKSFLDNKVTIELNFMAITSAQLSGNVGFIDLGSVLSHEGGHVIYDIPNMTKNLKWQTDNNVPQNYNGHNIGDPSGISADYHEQKYKNSYFKKN